MPRKGITIYDLLISCPGDVSEYLEILKESVENFNRVFGVLNNIEVVIKHWSTDSYPESGDKPQELLNKQFVRDCDAAVAIFWTRFGTPTDNYGSGTEEEIEEMLSADKQVFMYFLDAPINPSEVDMNQYQKVIDFKQKYKDRGVYAVVKDKHDFQRQFTNHLSLYFLSLISGQANSSNYILKPILTIRDINTSSDEYYSSYKNHLLESKFINKRNEEIIETIEELKNTILSKGDNEGLNLIESKYEEKSNTYKNGYPSELENSFNNFIKDVEYVKVNENIKNIINAFASENKIILDNDFWNVGNLKRYRSVIQLPYVNSALSYDGTDEEKDRYSSLKDLYSKIKSYNQYTEYFEYIDSIEIVKLMISNLGKTYDEDIDIKLMIPKGYLLKHHDLPYPGINIIEEVLDMKLVEFLFSIDESDTVSSYGYYQIKKPNSQHINNFNSILGKSMTEEYEDNKEDYCASLNSLFLYKQFENPKFDILIFDIKYLKHNSSMAFPSVLMFKNAPQTIEYEITSKHIPDVIKGKINLKS